MMNESINPWKVNGVKEIYDNKWIGIAEYDVVNPSGGKGIYGKVHFKNIAIGVLVLDEKQHTYLVGQYRFVLNEYSWEMPEGGGPKEEAPLDAAKRELLEETGLVADEWKEILRMHLSNSVSDELAVIFLATGITQQTACPEETEQLALQKLPFEEVFQMVMNGKITDAMTVAAVMKVKLMLIHGTL